MRSTDNVRWASQDREAALGFDTGGGVVLKAESPVWRSSVSPAFNVRRFVIGENVDADEYGVRSDHVWSTTDRIQSTLKLDRYRDSTLTTELNDAGARQNDVANRETLTVQPGIVLRLNETTNLNAGFLYSDVSFSDDGGGRLFDYSFKQASSSFSKTISDSFSFYISGFISQFDVPAQDSATETYGGQVGISYQLDETILVDSGVGYVQSSIEFQQPALAIIADPLPRVVQIFLDRSESSSGPIANFSIQKSFHLTRAKLDYVRRVSPTIRGSQSLEDDISVSIERDISRRFLCGFRGGYNIRSSESEDIAGNIFDLNRDQAFVSSFVGYKFSKSVSVRTEYRFAHSVSSTTSNTVDTSALFFTFVYSGTPQYIRGL